MSGIYVGKISQSPEAREDFAPKAINAFFKQPFIALGIKIRKTTHEQTVGGDFSRPGA